jgi:two-component system response regulator PilR (NtrC family)
VLVVDDEPDLLTVYELALVREGYDVHTAASVQEASATLAGQGYDAVITDLRLPDGSGIDLLRRLEQAGRPERVIVITAYGSPETAVQAGAYDYLTKPVDLRQFRNVVASALGRRPANDAGFPASAARRTLADDAPAVEPLALRPARADAGLATTPAPAGSPAEPAALRRMVGRSAAMQQVRALVLKVARSMAPVLLQGESGTGKEVVARAIHEAGVRAEGPFVPVNCGAIPEHLLEAEFFGYRKGAFTGAVEDRAGFFQAARGGTLFLDEIGDLPLAMQSKLLRAVMCASSAPRTGTWAPRWRPGDSARICSIAST